jgi:hypothetical protein
VGSPGEWRAVLLGDVVASKTRPDRADLQRRLQDALGFVNDAIVGVQPLEVTIGDEFQGAYRSLADAVRATLLVRLSLPPDVDTRFGLGSGTVTVFDAGRRPISQDGPAWWAAREAIERVRRRQQRSGHERAGAPGTSRGRAATRPDRRRSRMSSASSTPTCCAGTCWFRATTPGGSPCCAGG